jgi:hypothetical protein
MVDHLAGLKKNANKALRFSLFWRAGIINFAPPVAALGWTHRKPAWSR